MKKHVNPLCYEAIERAEGRFVADDVGEILASRESDRSADWIVKLREGRGLDFGVVSSSTKEGRVVEAAIHVESTIARAIRHVPSGPRGDLWQSLAERLLDEIEWSTNWAIRALMGVGRLFVLDFQDHEDPDLREVAGLAIRLDDTFSPLQRRWSRDGERFRADQALLLFLLHAIDPEHGIHAWGVSSRKEPPRFWVAAEMREIGYDVDDLVRGKSALAALGLPEVSGV